jgi:2-phospho-L-lactate guanylyltransferase
MSGLWAVLPAKGFGHAKSRLGEVLTDPVRAAFARGLFEHVLGTMRATTEIANVLVLTDDDEVEQLARARGARVLRDEPGGGLARIIDAGLAKVAELGAEAALVCMADLPHVSPEDLRAAAHGLLQHAVVVAPDAGEAGTNLLALKPATLFASCFGRADSFQRHLARAEEEGQQTVVLRVRGLCFDVDGPEDLEQLEP